MTRTDPGCGGHAGLPGELRAVVLLALDRITPVLQRASAEPATATSCANCPVCAVLAALRGERPELAVRLAEQASGLLALLRAAFEDGTPTPSPAPPTRTVQHIHVDRATAPR